MPTQTKAETIKQWLKTTITATLARLIPELDVRYAPKIESISVNGTPQTISNKNVDITIDDTGSNKKMADVLEFALSNDTVYIGQQTEDSLSSYNIEEYINNNLLTYSSSGYYSNTNFLKWSPPITTTISTGTWNRYGNAGERYNKTDVTAILPDNSSLTTTVTFFASLPAPGLIFAAKLSNPNSYIDTGLIANPNAVFEATGYIPYPSMGIFVGVSNNTSNRNTLRILSNSNKIQAAWSSLYEITNSMSGINCRKMISYVQSYQKCTLSQDDIIYEAVSNTWSNTFSITVENPILLFGETTASTNNYGYGVIREVKIRPDINASYERIFLPARLKSGEIVMINLADNSTLQSLYESKNINEINAMIMNSDFDIGGTYESNVYRPVNNVELVEITQTDYNNYLNSL